MHCNYLYCTSFLTLGWTILPSEQENSANCAQQQNSWELSDVPDTNPSIFRSNEAKEDGLYLLAKVLLTCSLGKPLLNQTQNPKGRIQKDLLLLESLRFHQTENRIQSVQGEQSKTHTHSPHTLFTLHSFSHQCYFWQHHYPPALFSPAVCVCPSTCPSQSPVRSSLSSPSQHTHLYSKISSY